MREERDVEIRKEVVVDGKRYEIVVRKVKKIYNGKERKIRVHFLPVNYDPIRDLITGERFNRPYRIYRQVLPEVLSEFGIENVKAEWSQYAGCKCGCSPGFILDKVGDYDIHVNYEIKQPS